MIPSLNADILIIGAGISGMVAANNILEHDKDLKILILEAKGRIGGRTLTIPMEVTTDKFCPVDLGGHWISSEQKILMRLLENLNLTLVPQYRNGLAIGDVGNTKIYSYKNHPIIGNWFSRYELKNFFGKLEYLSGRILWKERENLKEHYMVLDSITMESYIEKNLFTNIARQVARMLITVTCGIEPAYISVLCYILYCNDSVSFSNQYMTNDGGAREFWIKEGAQEICNRLAQKIENDSLLMNCPVLKIKYTKEYVTVTTPKGTYRSLYVIIAIPPTEVAKIDFNPMLSNDRNKVLIHTTNERLVKFVICYKENFWRPLGFSGEIFNCGEDPIHMCYDASSRGVPILIGYIFKKGRGSYKNKVIRQLTRYWGSKAQHPLNYIEKNWLDEEYIGSCPRLGPILNVMKYYYKLSEPIERLHWAGTETSAVWNGYMEGAMQAGLRASLEILYHLRPQSLSFNDMINVQYNTKHRRRLLNKGFLLSDNRTLLAMVIGGTIISLMFIYKKYFMSDQ